MYVAILLIIAAYHVFHYLEYNFPTIFQLYKCKIMLNLIITSFTIVLRGAIKIVENFELLEYKDNTALIV